MNQEGRSEWFTCGMSGHVQLLDSAVRHKRSTVSFYMTASISHRASALNLLLWSFDCGKLHEENVVCDDFCSVITHAIISHDFMRNRTQLWVIEGQKSQRVTQSLTKPGWRRLYKDKDTQNCNFFYFSLLQVSFNRLEMIFTRSVSRKYKRLLCCGRTSI